MRGLVIIAFILSSCSPTMSVLVIETLEDGKYHVVGMKDNYSNVIKLPDGTSEGDIVKIKVKKQEK